MRQKDISLVSIACTTIFFCFPILDLRLLSASFSAYIYLTLNLIFLLIEIGPETRENCPEFMPNLRNMRSTSSWQIAVCIWDAVKK